MYLDKEVAMDNNMGPPEPKDYSIVRENLGFNVRFTLKNSKWYSQNEIAEAFHSLGKRSVREICGKEIMIPKGVHDVYTFFLEDA